MNWASWILWGFVATVAMTTLEAIAQGMRLTRVDIPLLLGTTFTPSRDRAKVYGFLVHLLNGWAFALIYLAIFHALGFASWWIGALIGVAHTAFVLAVLMPLMPAIHPRMASATRGPTPTRMLEPPGFLGLHYGVRTPLSVLFSHVAFGAILGAFYRIASG